MAEKKKQPARAGCARGQQLVESQAHEIAQLHREVERLRAELAGAQRNSTHSSTPLQRHRAAARPENRRARPFSNASAAGSLAISGTRALYFPRMRSTNPGCTIVRSTRPPRRRRTVLASSTAYAGCCVSATAANSIQAKAFRRALERIRNDRLCDAVMDTLNARERIHAAY